MIPAVAGRAQVPDGQLAEHARRLVHSHGRILADSVRNRAFHRALARRVTPGSVVLDIGAGTGVWAIAAALLGARKVVAIEADEVLIGLIRRLAAECGVGDRVHPVCGWSSQVQLEREFDVVVSETIGYDGFEELIVPIMIDARNRFLRPGGTIIPETVALVAAVGHYRPLAEPTPKGLPFEFSSFADLRLETPIRLRGRKLLRLLTEPRTLLDVDLRTPPEPSVLESMKASWSVQDGLNANCFAVWVESRLAPSIRLSTRRTASWTPVLYPFRPGAFKVATIELDLCLSVVSRWRTSLTADGVTESQVRSPLGAGRRLLAESAPPASTGAAASITPALPGRRERE